MRDDPTRLAQLRRLMILDTPSEADYDDITRRLADTLQVPIAIVNLPDSRRDWFKACVGVTLHESPAATSFCEAFFHEAQDVIVVQDTLADSRFATHPLVTGAPLIRFYAAARLAIDGQTLGTLCAYDLSPREITTEQVAQLQLLSSAVVDLLRKRAPG